MIKVGKLPTQQIYLLLIIIVGIIALSVYSTYAIFTFEGETSNIVSMYTPNSLTISEDIYEYKQITVGKNSYVTTDIDIYNAHEYEICYRVWYQVVDDNIDSSLVKLYQINSTNELSSGVIAGVGSTRVSIIITNDNDRDVKVNIGLSSTKNEGTCSLNIKDNLSIITETISDYQELTKAIMNSTTSKNHEAGYLRYQNIKTPITLDSDKIYISDNYTYQFESFTLTNEQSIDLFELEKYQSTEEKKYYTCLNNEKQCEFLYQINTITKETIKDEITNQDKDIYKLTNYDKLIGYLKGTSGIKKITIDNQDNYLYYGDNPNNFIYYNCQNSKDLNTCELWRIIGLTYDQKENKYLTKIIKNDSIDSFTYSDNDSNLWNESNIYKYLSDEYKVNNYEYLEEITYKQTSLTDLSLNIDNINYLETSNKSKFHIINLTDYLYSSSCSNQIISTYDENCLKNNWLNNNDGTYWTMTAKVAESITNTDNDNLETTQEPVINKQVYSVSDTINLSNTKDSLLMRPVAYLKSRMLLVGGDGSLDNPYIIK